MRYSKYAFVAVVGIAAGLFESVFVTFLGGWISWVRPIIPLAVFLVVLERRNFALFFCLCSGLVMDAFILGPPTLAVWRLLLAVAVMSAVADKVLTNRSVYAAAMLVVLGRSVDFSWLWIEQMLFDLRGIPTDLVPAKSEALGILAWDLGLTVGLFLFGMYVLRHYLRPRRMLNRYV